MDYTLTAAPSARRDLKEIVEYISLDNAEAAQRFTAFLVGKTRALAQFPEKRYRARASSPKSCGAFPFPRILSTIQLSLPTFMNQRSDDLRSLCHYSIGILPLM